MSSATGSLAAIELSTHGVQATVLEAANGFGGGVAVEGTMGSQRRNLPNDVVPEIVEPQPRAD